MTNKELLKKFKAGKCSKEELRKVLKWYQSNDAEIDFTHQIERLWQEYSDESSVDPFDEKGVLQRINSNISGNKKDISLKPGPSFETDSKRKIISLKLYYLAASIVILLGVVFGLTKLDDAQFGIDGQALEDQMIVKSTSKGQKTTIFLSDGSKVKLNANSKLVFPQEFTGSERNVYLEGEGFFEVAINKSKPFTVETDHVTTMALGTSFNVRDYINDDQATVSLATGVVLVNRSKTKVNSKTSDAFRLNPGDQVIYNKSNEDMTSTTFDPKRILSWKDDILYFEDADWGEIVTTLENWYGVQIDVRNTLKKDKLYTGEFKDESLQNVLESIGFTKNFDYTIEGQHVGITFKN